MIGIQSRLLLFTPPGELMGDLSDAPQASARMTGPSDGYLGLPVNSNLRLLYRKTNPSNPCLNPADWFIMVNKG